MEAPLLRGTRRTPATMRKGANAAKTGLPAGGLIACEQAAGQQPRHCIGASRANGRNSMSPTAMLTLSTPQ